MRDLYVPRPLFHDLMKVLMCDHCCSLLDTVFGDQPCLPRWTVHEFPRRRSWVVDLIETRERQYYALWFHSAGSIV